MDEAHAFALAKRDSQSTWELIVLPGKPFWPRVASRACFLCGDCCVNFRDVLCEDVDEWLAQQACLADNCFHQAMRNMLTHARTAQAAFDSGVQPYLAVCLSCDNYLRTHKGMPFFSGVQTLHWHMNTLQEPHGVKIDKRMLFGLCKRLSREQDNKQNVYLGLFSPEERRTIKKIAECRPDTAAAQQALLGYVWETNKRSFLVASADIAHKLRQYKFRPRDVTDPNVYKVDAFTA